MTIRTAKSRDAKDLARLHIECSKAQPGGFMHRLGLGFLVEYYRVSMKEKFCLIIVAEDEDGKIVGLHSGTLRAEEHAEMLRRSKWRLGMASLPRVLRNPKLIFDSMARANSGSADTEKDGYVVKTGPRGEYWGWSPSSSNPGGALALHRAWHEMMKAMGATLVRSEIDTCNSRILKFAKTMGARVVKEMQTPEGEKRLILEYDLAAYGK